MTWTAFAILAMFYWNLVKIPFHTYRAQFQKQKNRLKCHLETSAIGGEAVRRLLAKVWNFSHSIDSTSLNALQCTTFTLVIRLLIKPEVLVSMPALLCMRLNIMFPLVAFLWRENDKSQRPPSVRCGIQFKNWEQVFCFRLNPLKDPSSREELRK